MKKYLIAPLLFGALIHGHGYAVTIGSDIVDGCLRDPTESTSLKPKSVFNPDFVDRFEDSLTTFIAEKQLGAPKYNIVEKNIHDKRDNITRIFQKDASVAIFVVGPKPSKKTILICSDFSDRNLVFDNWLRIGLRLDEFKKRLNFHEDVSWLEIERGETVMDFYFKDGILYRFTFRGDYNG